MELAAQISNNSTEKKPRMNVLIACEESQEVCKAFRAKGHRAFSCDLQECSGGHPEWHIYGDALAAIDPMTTVFLTQDGSTHTHTVGLDYRTSTMHLSQQRRCLQTLQGH